MPEELLTASQVKERFGYTRNNLLGYEEQGKIKPVRSSGGQRRYKPADIQALTQVTEPRTPNYHELGVTGLNRWGGSVREEPLHELQGRSGRKLFREMRLNDPVISAVFFAVENTLKQALWRVKPASEAQVDIDAAEFIEGALHDMSQSFNDVLAYALQMLEQGFSVLEVVYKRRLGPNPPGYTKDAATSKYSDGRIGWRKWAPRPAETLIEGDEWVFDDAGGVQGINQAPDSWPGTVVTIPIDKLLLFRTTCVPANNPEGMPMHRAAYTSYYFSKNLQEIEGIGIERDLGGLPVIYLGNDCSINEDDPNSDYSLAKDLVVNVRMDEQAGIVIPHQKMNSDGNGMLFELVSSAGQRAHNVGDIIERYDKRKALVVLAQFIMLGMDRVGSFALSKHQGDLFSIAIQAWLENIADTINRYAIPRLFEYNVFPGITGYPQLVPSEVRMPDLVEVATYINTLAGKNLIHPDAELERHLRQLARLPELKEPSEDSDTSTNLNYSQRDPQDTAMLLRRVLLVLESMAGMGVEDTEEMAASAKKLINELIASLGVTEADIAAAPSFELPVDTGGGWGNEPKPQPANGKSKVSTNPKELPNARA